MFLRMNERLTSGVQDELLDLLRLRSLKPEKAWLLYNNKITSVKEVNEANPDSLMDILRGGEGFLSRKKQY